MKTIQQLALIGTLLTLGVALLDPGSAMAHCDGMDGPVVKAAQEALASGNIYPALVWVQKQDEEEIGQAFDRTLAVRKLGPDAEALADMYFFETLVRIHRAGEGAPYTGLKPAGRDLGPAIPLADQALTIGNVDPVVELITDKMRNGLTERFRHAMETRNYSTEDVKAGRQYVAAYVNFLHYVERAYEAAAQPAVEHLENQHALESHD